jgi:hypothetical protein
MKRIDEQGPDALLQLREPVNKFPDFVRYIVQCLKSLGPSMGKGKIAETLCRAGLHLSTTTVGRILKEEPQPAPADAAPCTGVVTAKRSQPCLACRPHGRSDIGRLLGTVVAVRITPVLAVLLVCGGSQRSLFSTCNGHCHVQELADITIDSALSRTCHGQRRC